MKLTLTDKIILTGGVLMMILLSLLLYRIVMIKQEPATGDAQGVITWRYRVAQRKYSSTVVWENVSQNANVYNHDTIRTDFLSEASIKLNDGTSIELDQESMVVLNLKKDEGEVKLIKGNIKVDRSKLTAPMPNFVVEARNRSFSMGTAEATFSKIDEELYINPLEGAVTYKNGDREESISRGITALFSADEIFRLPSTIRLIEPPENAHVFVEEANEAVEFRWSSRDKNRTFYLELSDTRDFKKIRDRLAFNTNTGAARLSPGIHYWRVRTNLTDTVREGNEIRRITLIRKERPNPVSPAPDSEFLYYSSPPFILFSWEKTPGARSYRLDVSRTPDMREVVSSREVFQNRISLTLEKGVYYWRITPSGPYQNSFMEGPVLKLTVDKKKSISPPVPGLPVEGSVFSMDEMKERGITFNWTMETELNDSLLELSTDRNFGTVPKQIRVKGNFHTLKEISGAGTWYWRVRGQAGDNIRSPYSAVSRFTIRESQGESPKKTESVEPAEPEMPAQEEKKPAEKTETKPRAPEKPEEPRVPSLPGILKPSKGQVLDMSDQDRIPFTWSGANGARYYIFRLYFKGARVFQTETQDTTYLLTDLSVLDTGKFTWSVEAVGDSDNLKSGEAKSDFIITLSEGPAAPSGITTQPQK